MTRYEIINKRYNERVKPFISICTNSTGWIRIIYVYKNELFITIHGKCAYCSLAQYTVKYGLMPLGRSLGINTITVVARG